MALIINPGGSEIRGSIGSQTYARNRYGAYMRARAIPVNPRTPAQIAARNCLQEVSSCWRSLTPLEQSGWNEAAQNFPVSNKVGQTVYLTGQALFVRLNTVRKALGLSISSSTPSPVDFNTMGLTFDFQDLEPGLISLGTVGTLNAAFSLKLEATRQLSPGVTFVKRSDYKCIKYLTTTELPGPDTPYDAIFDYQPIFGAIVTGRKVFMRVSAIYEATGEMVVSWEGSKIAF